MNFSHYPRPSLNTLLGIPRARKRINTELGITAARKPFRWWRHFERRGKRRIGWKSEGGRSIFGYCG